MSADDQPQPEINQPHKTVPPRLVVTENLYHQTPGYDPLQVSSTFSRYLESDEQSYERRCKVGEEWKPLDTGWLGDNVGMLVICNEEGRCPQQTNPTEEEKEEAKKKVLEVSYNKQIGANSWFIPPGESMRGLPSNPRNLMVRSQHGIICLSVHLTPK